MPKRRRNASRKGKNVKDATISEVSAVSNSSVEEQIPEGSGTLSEKEKNTEDATTSDAIQTLNQEAEATSSKRKRTASTKGENGENTTVGENSEASNQNAEEQISKENATMSEKPENTVEAMIDEDSAALNQKAEEKKPKRKRTASRKLKDAEEALNEDTEDSAQKSAEIAPKRKRTASVKVKHAEDASISEDTENLIQRAKGSAQSPLVLAIIENNTNAFQELLDSGYKLNSKMTNTPMTPLHYAAKNGNLQIVKYLFDNGHSKLKQGKQKVNKETPLYFAVENRHTEVVKFLIENGHKENLSNHEVHALVRMCIESDHLDIIKCLITSSEGIDEEDSESETLLHDAATYGRLEIIKYLLEMGANVHVKTDYNETPLHYAIRKQHVEVVRELVEISRSRVTVYDTLFNDLSVHIAAEIGNVEIFMILLEAGYPTDCILKEKAPIHLAAEFGHLKLMELLIEKGVDVDTLTKHDETTLSLAIASGELSVVKFLLEAGASVTGKNRYRGIPINCVLEQRKWKSSIPLESMIDRQVEILRCLLNRYPLESLQECLQSALRTVSTPKLLYVLLEYNVDFGDPALSSFSGNDKCLAALIDDVVNPESLMHSLRDFSQRQGHQDLEYRRFFREIVIARLAVILSVSEDSKMESELAGLTQWGIKDRYDECKKQIATMKETKIDQDFKVDDSNVEDDETENSKVTYYDMVSKPLDNIANYMKHEKMITTLESNYDKFPAFSSILETRVAKGKERILLIHTSVNSFFKIIQENQKIKLPDSLIKIIFENLSPIDLRKLIEACS